ncbi:MAG TPA: cysteine desulfurase, partial [Ruminococcaceae bacterium]|nr:cysteine desulfurase [Oscillospiraceae bacterium]
SGSACSKGAKSGVLDEFGLSQKLADSALRISFDFSDTKEEIDKFVDVLKEGQQKILKSK